MKVHLVDGTFELFRAHFGAPSATSPGGQEVGATRGLMRSLLALATEPDVSHVAVAFDTVIESFRNRMFDGYKTGEDLEPVLLEQFPLAERACRALGIATWSMMDHEADDGLASGAHYYGGLDEVEQVVIASPDKDLAQCVVGDRIVTLDRMRRTVRDEDAVVEKFGVRPKSIPDWLGLVGDSADGIPGLPKWGAKSAAKVLHYYNHLGDIPHDHDLWEIKVRGAAGLATVLRENYEAAELYVKLATLVTDAPIDRDLEAIAWRGADREALETLCAELGDERFVGRVGRFR